MTEATGTSRPRKKAAKLHYCDLDACEGICCSDGAFLLAAEERLIHRLVKKYPEHFPQLPENYIADGEWEGNTGRKTATRPFDYRNKPEHFANTRCVFSEADGKCGLQTLAVKAGKHKWAYKPMGCWLFPLEADGGKLIAPPRNRRDDPTISADAIRDSPRLPRVVNTSPRGAFGGSR